MSSSIYLKNPPSDWTDVYFNSVNTDTLNVTGGTGIFGTVQADLVIGNTGLFNQISGITGSFDYIQPIAPSNSIQYFGKGNFRGQLGAVLPMYTFDSFITQATGTSVMKITDQTSAFAANLASILNLDASSAVTLGGGTNFIRCTSLAAGGAPYTDNVVFNVASDGEAEALAFNVWSSVDYKKNILPVQIDSRKLKNIEPATYQYISDSDDKQRIGIMWEDLEKLHPHACNHVRREVCKEKIEKCESYDEVCDKCNSHFKCENHEEDEIIEIAKDNKTVDLAGAVGVLFSVVKDLERRVSELETNCLKYIK